MAKQSVVLTGLKTSVRALSSNKADNAGNLKHGVKLYPGFQTSQEELTRQEDVEAERIYG
jgi:hypothetical protein